MKTKSLLTLSAALLLLVGCGSTSTSSKIDESSEAPQSSETSSAGKESSAPASSPTSTGGNVEAGKFVITADLDKVYDIHTTDQANYLGFTGDYYNITSSDLNKFNAKGNASSSLPNAVPMKWEHTPADGKTLSYYSVTYGQKADLSDGYDKKGSSSPKMDIYNSYLGDNYFKVIAHYSDQSTAESEIYKYKVNTQAPRNLKIGSMENCRDVGGRTTTNGAVIRQGLLYRTAEPGSNPSSEIKEEMINHLGMKTEIYVKDGGNNDGTSTLGGGIKYYNCNMDYGTGAYSNLSRNAERVRRVFSLFAKKENYPIFYHCRIGTDRTGIVGVLSNGVLGMAFQDVMQDYCFSNFAKIDGQRFPNKSKYEADTNGDDPAKYIDEILKMPGANFQEQCWNALRTIGVPESDLTSFMDIMLEGEKPNNSKGQVFVTADQFTLNGATLSKATDYKNPNNYVAIKSGKSVSAKATTTAQNYTVVVYLGNKDKSTSKKLSSGISVKVDGTAMTVPQTNHEKAGFGTTGQSRRVAYMFQFIGKQAFTAGDHTIEVAGLNSDEYNVASIELIPGELPTERK